MSVFIKFKSEKVFDSLPIDGPFISTAECKRAIIDKKKLKHCDLTLINADTNEGKITFFFLFAFHNLKKFIFRFPKKKRI